MRISDIDEASCASDGTRSRSQAINLRTPATLRSTPDTVDRNSSELPGHNNEERRHGKLESILSSTGRDSSEVVPSPSRSQDRCQGIQCSGCGRLTALCRSELPNVPSGLLGHNISKTVWLVGNNFRCSRLHVLSECYFFEQRRTYVVAIGLMLLVLHASLALLEGICLNRWSYKRHAYDILVCGFLILPLTAAAFVTRARTKVGATENGAARRIETWSLAKIKWIGFFFFIIIFVELQAFVLIWPPPRRPSTGIWFAALASCLVHTMVPMTLFTSLCLVALMDATYLTLVSVLAEASTGHLTLQISLNAFILLLCNIIGVTHRLLMEHIRRQCFRDICKCLKSTRRVMAEITQQNALLHTMLPEDVAKSMKKSINRWGALETSTEFNALNDTHLQRWENVSILFADIKGFTEISSTMSASKVVELLNDLFASFDELAHNLKCRRIRLLGDCYYCVSGILPENKEHADSCVKLGLKMILETKRQAKRYGVDLAIRVGVNSGAVLAGVIGLHKWCYDVWSNDVTLASRLESSGEEGVVHISQETLNLLHDSYNFKQVSRPLESPKLLTGKTYFVFPGIKLDESCSSDNFLPSVNNCLPELSATRANIQRLSVSSTLPFSWTPEKPFANLDVTSMPRRNSLANALKEVDVESAKAVNEEAEGLELEPFPYELSCEAPQHVAAVCDMVEMVLAENIIKQVKNELLHPVWMRFRNDDLEKLYQNREDRTFARVTILATFLLLGACGVLSALLPPPELSKLFASSNVISMILLALAAISEWQHIDWKWAIKLNRILQRNTYARHAIMTFVYLCCLAFVATSLLSCSTKAPDLEKMHTADHGTKCLDNVEYYILMTIISLQIVSILFIRANFYYISSLAVVSTAALVGVAYGPYRYVFDRQHRYLKLFSSDEHFMGFLHLSVFASLLTVVLTILHARMVDAMQRMDFIYLRRTYGKRLSSQQLKHDNKQLLYNILPSHVAQFYLNTAHAENGLYHQAHESIAVMFASIPDFSEYYTETKGNEMGIGCIRLLNAIISDFDQLLRLPKFAGVEKIKTIGSTYMVAAGLDMIPTDNDCPAAVLADFGFALQETLSMINQNSFNNFQMRLGLHQGPAVSGVVGAKRPMFDVWGDTVNIASRMESTGVKNALQVAQETANLLRAKGYTITERGSINVKGKGLMKTCFISQPPTKAHEEKQLSDAQGSVQSSV